MKACAAGGSSLPPTAPKERNRSAAAPFNQYGAPGLGGAPELAEFEERVSPERLDEVEQACCTPGRARIVHFTPPATQRASLSRSGDLTVASFIKIIDSGHQDSQYLATLPFDATAGAAQDECPASPSSTVVGWMATRMAAMPTTVARLMPVPIDCRAVGGRRRPQSPKR